jgi:hypothetical protein
MNIRALILCAPVVLLSFSMKANTFTVTVTSDSGTGSLRQAIIDANAHAGLDTITFNLPVGTIHTIALAFPLPTIIDPVVIDGTTQPGFTGMPIIELNGSSAGSSARGLEITAGNCTVRGLVINRFSSWGIHVSLNGSNIIQGNFIGTDATGTVALGNSLDAVAVDSGNNVIGGTTAAAANLLSGNARDGVDLSSSGNVVQGNLIGTDVSGTNVLANGRSGVSIFFGAQTNIVGGTVLGARNVISGNGGDGVLIGNQNGSSNTTGNNIVQGNFIGTDANGTLALGNSGNGINIFNSAASNTIGGTTAGAGNVIWNNRGNGILITTSTAINNAILSNSIYDNGGLGIDLGGDGVTPNDPGDIDTGPNNLENYPILTLVTNGAGNTSIAGRLNSAANTSYRIEFFANDTIDPSGFGEGQSFVGFTNATTDASGNVSFNVSVPQIAAGRQVTATATDPNGNTSEFSAAFGAPVITSPLTATATVGQLFVYQITATNNPTTFGAAPLPAGLSLDSDSGILGGTPTDPGTTQIQLTASNSFGTGMKTLTLTVQPFPSSGPVIASGTSITARTGDPFSFEVFTTGGSATARLTATGLPPGLSADPVTGVISGTPTADGSFRVTLTVRDGALTTTSTLQLTFTSDPAIPVITNPREAALTAGQFFTYTIDAPSSDHSGTTFSLIGNLPLGLGFDPATGTISGTYNPGDQNGGALLGNVQTNTHNSSGSGTNPLSFFQAVPATAVNISTRLAVGTGDNVLIGGFIVTGNAPKKVIVRAIGPSLTAQYVPGALQDPMLELHNGTGALIARNDDWHTTQIGGLITSNQSAAIQASGLAPTDHRESAMLVTLAQHTGNPASLTGHYTTIIRGKNGTTGAALVEVYDVGTASLDVSSNAQLANISTRGLVQTGDNVMIGGFIVRGDMPATVIVRAIGPSLAQHGITNPLQDPTLELHDHNGTLIAFNDNWMSAPNRQAIINSGQAPSNNLESAILRSLSPGNYTAIVRGKNGTSGVALVEAYVIP